MPFDYARDNMERRPYEFYIEEYRQTDPMEISTRLGIAYDVQKSEFIIFLWVLITMFPIRIFG